jgi:hypothetical protein
MAVYKVIQDIEAEDKLLGPLTFKGLIYAGITVICGFINIKLLGASALGPVKWLFIFILLFPMVLFGVLASPIGREQPTEVWLLARIRFFLKPRLRIWDQTGITELVTITVPKKMLKQLTKNFTQSEVNSRLQALATTLDSRGWAVKNINVNLNSSPNYFQAQDESDRLVATEGLIKEVPTIEVRADDDILDERSNPTAQNFQSLMAQAEEERRQEMTRKLEAARQAEAMARAESPKAPSHQEAEEQTHAHHEKIHDLRPIYEIHRGAGSAKVHATKSEAPNRVTDPGQADKLELAQSGNDLSVASVAKLANRSSIGKAEAAFN